MAPSRSCIGRIQACCFGAKKTSDAKFDDVLPSAEEAEELGGFVAVRHKVQKDNNCLFNSLAYLAGAEKECTAVAMRKICAQEALEDSEPQTRALLLGFESVAAYSEWILDESHWGGENEVLVLAKHYGLEVVVVCCQSLRVFCYGSDDKSARQGRVYVLYTGNHYDPIVTQEDIKGFTTQVKRFPQGDSSFDAAALRLARQCIKEDAAEARAAAARCSLCGARSIGKDHHCNGYHYENSLYASKTGSMY
eukprot:TRINITY_DN32423_c0_g1_i1.p1 TRINITY_DN32423_c0_g1~~TRINITY_DN32423_c0_g1_i1.p1  ORF type:complete len:250 (-),score=38.90 TRINITY_DN32423_c0_g1_i1:246-995(-)